MSKEPREKRLRSPNYGMTINERLFAAGLLSDWDDAAIARDRTKMIELLMATDVLMPDAEQIADTVLAYPEQYGF